MQAEGQAHDLCVRLMCEVIGGGRGEGGRERPQEAVTPCSVGNFLTEEDI